MNAVTPLTAAFDKYSAAAGYENVVVTALPVNGATVSKLFIGTTEIAKGAGGANWAVSNNTVTLKVAYLETLTVGNVTFTLTFSTGNSVEFAVTVSDSTPVNSINPATAVFDKNTSGETYADVETTMASTGTVTLSSVKNGENTVAAENYDVADGVLTVKKEYLGTLDVGAVTLTLVFSAGNNATLTVTVSDTTGG